MGYLSQVTEMEKEMIYQNAEKISESICGKGEMIGKSFVKI